MALEVLSLERTWSFKSGWSNYSDYVEANSVLATRNGLVWIAEQYIDQEYHDVDVFLTIYAASNGQWLKTYSYGSWDDYNESYNDDYPTDLATSSDGQFIYLTGTNQDILKQQNGFLLKYDLSGKQLWERKIATSAKVWCQSIASAPNGAIYVAGSTYGNLDGITNKGAQDAFISRYEPDGSRAWTALLGSSLADWAHSVTLSQDGSLYITGVTYGNLQKENGDLYIQQGNGDTFLSKYDQNGNNLWTRVLGSANYDKGNSVITSNDGSIFVVGDTSGNLAGIPGKGGNDMFLSKFASDGQILWTTLIGTQFEESALSATLSEDGFIYVTGITYGNFDGITNSGNGDAFLVKYSTDGVKQWAQLISSSGTDWAKAITSGEDGDLYIVGLTNGNLFGDPSSGTYDSFITKFEYPELSQDKVNSSLQTYILSTSRTTVDEGDLLSVTVTTSNVASGTTLYYSWGGKNIDSGDFASDGNLYGGIGSSPSFARWGSVQVTSNGQATFSQALRQDEVTEGIEFVEVQLYSDADKSKPIGNPLKIEVNDTSTNPIVIPPTIDLPKTTSGTAIDIPDTRNPVVVVTSSGSPDLISISAPVNATLNALTTESHGIDTIARNVGTLTSPGTGQIVSLKGVGKYSFVATSIPEATTTINLEPNKNTAFFLHDAYSDFYEGLTLTPDSSGRYSTQRVLNVDTIKMGSAGGTSIVDLTSKDYVTGAVTVYGANQGRSILWGTSSNDTFISGGGDSVIFGGGGANQLTLGTGKDTIQYRSGANATDKVSGFVLGQDKVELWIGKDQVTIEPRFDLVNGSTVMTWGGNTVEFVGVADLNLSNLLPITRTA